MSQFIFFRPQISTLTTRNTDTETGPGVYETALAYTSALRMADNAVLYKYLAKSIGMRHGVLPSFMAKPWGNVRTRILYYYEVVSLCLNLASRMQWVSVATISPLMGVSHSSSFRHIHVSLRDSSGKNSFALSGSELKTGRSDAAYDDTKFMSQEGEWFLAGVLDGIADGTLHHHPADINHRHLLCFFHQ